MAFCFVKALTERHLLLTFAEIAETSQPLAATGARTRKARTTTRATGQCRCPPEFEITGFEAGGTKRNNEECESTLRLVIQNR
eukprot:4841844-Pleurochrysis_carterae.AAC.1